MSPQTQQDREPRLLLRATTCSLKLGVAESKRRQKTPLGISAGQCTGYDPCPLGTDWITIKMQMLKRQSSLNRRCALMEPSAERVDAERVKLVLEDLHTCDSRVCQATRDREKSAHAHSESISEHVKTF